MSFAPIMPTGGYGGWKFLQRTIATQEKAFAADPSLRRDEEYFRTKIGSIKTAEDLVKDRRLLGVALGAFGLGADINNRFFIRKVLEDGTLKDGALANRLSDKSYEKLSAAFGFGDFRVANTQLSGFADKILKDYKARAFETAVGAQNGDLRLAMNTTRELSALAARPISEDAKWFSVMGSAPLRQVFEKALGLPRSLGALDLDTQLSTFREKASRVFGADTVSQFTDPARTETLVRQFLLRSEAATVATTVRGSGALALLQAANRRFG